VVAVVVGPQAGVGEPVDRVLADGPGDVGRVEPACCGDGRGDHEAAPLHPCLPRLPRGDGSQGTDGAGLLRHGHAVHVHQVVRGPPQVAGEVQDDHALTPSRSKMSSWTWCGSNSSGLYPPSDCPWLGSSHCTTSTPRHHVRSKPTTRARAPAGAAHPTLPSEGTVARKRAMPPTVKSSTVRLMRPPSSGRICSASRGGAVLCVPCWVVPRTLRRAAPDAMPASFAAVVGVTPASTRRARCARTGPGSRPWRLVGSRGLTTGTPWGWDC